MSDTRMMQHYYHIPDPANLPAMAQDDLDDIIKKHGRYMKGQNGGARAVVQYRNLSGLDFSNRNLSQADFTGCMMGHCDFSGGDFHGTSFFACDLRHAKLMKANLSRADFRGAYMANADLSQANMQDADMREGKIMTRGDDGFLSDRKRTDGDGGRTILRGARMAQTQMNKVQAKSVDFSDADLTGVILRDADLTGADFSGANLADCDMSRATLDHVTMKGAIIAGLTLQYTDRDGLDLEGVITERDMGRKLSQLDRSLMELLEEHRVWIQTSGQNGKRLDLSGYDLRDVIDLNSYSLTAVRAIEATFIHQNLDYAEMQSGVFDGSDFRDCQFLDADLRGSSFKYAQFARANLRGANLCPLKFKTSNGERLQRVDLSGANLRYSDLSECDLRDCIFMGADLTGARLLNADLRRADFTGATMEHMILDGSQTDDTIIDLRRI